MDLELMPQAAHSSGSDKKLTVWGELTIPKQGHGQRSAIFSPAVCATDKKTTLISQETPKFYSKVTEYICVKMKCLSRCDLCELCVISKERSVS